MTALTTHSHLVRSIAGESVGSAFLEPLGHEHFPVSAVVKSKPLPCSQTNQTAEGDWDVKPDGTVTFHLPLFCVLYIIDNLLLASLV